MRRSLEGTVGDWSPYSPAAINAWLLLVTTKLFLDEPSWARSGLEVRQVAHHICDPHGRGQVYEGFCGHTPEDRTVGKAPQHPTTHNLYRAEDMLGFLRSAPTPRTARRGVRRGSATAARR